IRRSTSRLRTDAPGVEPAPVLFGRIRVEPPPAPPRATPSPIELGPATTGTPQQTAVTAVGTTMIARVRKVSAQARPTQVQLPMTLETVFVHGIDSITNAETGESHNFVRTFARGSQNTLRVELPEIRYFSDPVVRFERTPDAILYRAFDRNSAEGREIM